MGGADSAGLLPLPGDEVSRHASACECSRCSRRYREEPGWPGSSVTSGRRPAGRVRRWLPGGSRVRWGAVSSHRVRSRLGL